MALKYVYRIDDIHPAMMWDRFHEVMKIFHRRGVIPLLGVIPDNQDKTLMFDKPNPNFFEIIQSLVQNGLAEICQHGYRHVYTTQQWGLNQILYGRVNQSEFARLPFEKQYQMIRLGKEILESHGLNTNIWMAPSHVNDRNTYRALKKLGFKYITDGIALYPYYKYGLLFVPQQLWQPKKEFPFGIFTVCLHLNDLDDTDMVKIREHMKTDDDMIPFSEATKYPQHWIHPWLNSSYQLKQFAYSWGVKPMRHLKAMIQNYSRE